MSESTVLLIIYVIGGAFAIALVMEMIDDLGRLFHRMIIGRRQRRQERALDRDRRRTEESTRIAAERERERREQDHATPLIHAERYYADHAEMLVDRYSPAMFEAFLRLEMHDELDTVTRWQAYRKLVAELQPLLKEERERRRALSSQHTQRGQRIQNIEREITSLNRRMDRIRQSGLDADRIEDETEGLLRQIRRLEEERDNLLTPTDDGDFDE